MSDQERAQGRVHVEFRVHAKNGYRTQKKSGFKALNVSLRNYAKAQKTNLLNRTATKAITRYVPSRLG